MIEFACSTCGRRIRVDDRHAGKTGKCPKCGKRVVVPGQVPRIQFNCPGCGHTIKVPASDAGRKGRCPKCKEPVAVPPFAKEPVRKTLDTTVTCVVCSQVLSVPEEASGEPIPCPQCGSYIDPASGDIVSPVAGMATEDDEQAYDEASDAVPRQPAGMDRRLILILSGVAAVVVAGLITLVVFLNTSQPSPGPGASPLRQAPAADANSAVPVAGPVERPEASEAEPGFRLRFAPVAGTRRTMRVNSELITSTQDNGREQDIVAIETFGFDLEVLPARTDGMIQLAITLANVQVKSGLQGGIMTGYDSTQPEDGSRSVGMWYRLFIGKPFSVGVSARGEIVACDLDALFHAAAEECVDAEDEQIRGRAGAAEQSRPRDERVLAMKKQLEAFPLMSRDRISGLLSELVVALPEGPVEEGLTWNAPMHVAQVDRRLEMAAVHTITALEDKVCTIQSKGQRTLESPPIVQTGRFTVRHHLGGTSLGTIRADRQTGWLLSREQTTSLNGQVETTGTGIQEMDGIRQVALQITVTVTAIE